MRGITKRVMALPVAAASAVALVVASSGAAHASSFESGSVSLTVNVSWLSQLAHAGVAFIPENYSSLTYNSSANTVTVTFTATAADASLNNGAGTVSLSGGIIGFSLHGKVVQLNSLLFDLTDAAFDGATTTSGEQPLVDLAGSGDGTVTPNADGSLTQVFTTSDLDIDPAGAALLNSALGTTVLTAGESIGSFSATWTN